MLSLEDELELQAQVMAEKASHVDLCFAASKRTKKISDGRLEHLFDWKVVYIWVNYNDLTVTSLEIMVSKGNHPQMALIQVSEIL